MPASTLSFLKARDFRAAQALHPDLELCPPTTGRSEDGAAPEELLFAEFVCLELATGKEKWRVPPAVGLGCGSVMATADGTLLILSERGELLTALATPAGFKATARHQVLGGRCWTVPVLAHGRIYCRNARGDLVCVKAGVASPP